MSEAWLVRACKRLKKARLVRADRNSFRNYEKKFTRAKVDTLSKMARQLYFQSIIEKSPVHVGASAHMVDASIVANLMLDLHDFVMNTPAQNEVERLLDVANANIGLQMPRADLDRRLEKIKRRSAAPKQRHALVRSASRCLRAARLKLS